jgi:hypothetical protein
VRVSAAIATGAAVKAKKEEISAAISVSLIVTVHDDAGHAGFDSLDGAERGGGRLRGLGVRWIPQVLWS